MYPMMRGCPIACILALLTSVSFSRGQEVPKLSDEKRASWIVQRDALAEQAVAEASKGEFDRAQTMFDQVFQIEASLFGDAHEELLGTLDNQAGVAAAAKDLNGVARHRRRAAVIASELYVPGDYRAIDYEFAAKDAEDNVQRSDEERKILEQARVLAARVGSLYSSQPSDAVDLAKQVIQLRQQVLGKEHLHYSGSVRDLAGLYRAIGEYESAEPLYLEAIAIQKQCVGEQHPAVADTLGYLALLYQSMGRHAEAERMHKQVLGIRGNTLGKAHPSYASSLNNLGFLYKSRGEYRNAERMYAQAQEIKEQALGKEHPSFATGLHNLAMLYLSMGDYRRAEASLIEAKQIREKTLGREHPDYAKSLNGLASLYQSSGNYKEAEPLYIEAKRAREKSFGRSHPEYARSLTGLALLYADMGDLIRAERLHVEALEIYESRFGKNHPDYARSLTNLAIVHYLNGDYALAEMMALEGKAIRERTFGKTHLDVANSLDFLADIYMDAGDASRSEPLYERAKSIHEEILGTSHHLYADSLGKLAAVHQSMGDYDQAEPMFVECNRILKEVLGQNHPAYSVSLNDHAMLYTDMGNYRRAEKLLLEAKRIQEHALDKKHPNYASILSNLASVYESMGDLAKAEQLHVESKAHRERVLGREHPDLAYSVNNLATLYLMKGELAKAEPLLLEAKAIWEKNAGDEHPEYAQTVHNLGALYQSKGEYEQSERFYLEAFNVRKKVVGTEHPDYAQSQHGLATLYHSMGDFKRADPHYRSAIDVTVKHLERSALVQSEWQQLLMNRSVRYQLDRFVECCIDGGLDAESAIERIVRWKGSVLCRGRDLRLAATDPAISSQFRQLQAISSRLFVSLNSVPSPERIEAWKDRTDALADAQQKLEGELVRRSAALRNSVNQGSLAEIRKAIPADAILIDYLEYRGQKGRSLAASVISKTRNPILVDLGSATDVADATDLWRSSYGMTSEARAAGAKLRKQLWEPLWDYVEQADLILVSTDGVLGRLPIAALPGKEPDSYLIEDHRLTMIPVPRLLPALLREKSPANVKRELLLIGDVDYDANVSDVTPGPSAKRKRTRPWQRAGLSTPVRGDTVWERLDETGAEVEFIAGLYQRLYDPAEGAIVDLRGEEATKSAFVENAGECLMVHLATHGYFAPPEAMSTQSSKLVDDFGNDRLRLVNKHRDTVFGYSPGQLSGLVFAGANRRPKINTNAGDVGDHGIMTADEIAYLPLDGVRLVVLSACETGLGEVAGGEGLLGIQRAFQIAGVRSTVATLWNVNDAATRRLMQEFYSNYLDREMNALDALREAQLWALRNPGDVPRGSIREKNEARGPSVNNDRLSPQYWAPFVLSGDWG